MDTLKGHPEGRPIRFVVGIVEAMPKLMVRRLLEPVLQLSNDLRLECVEGSLDELLSELMLHNIGIVPSDTAVTSESKVRSYNHSLGDSAVGLFATRDLARRYRKGFPESLNGAPLLVPRRNSALRRSLDSWIESQNLQPAIRAEFSDTALLKAFGQTGEGLFPGGLVIENEICRQYQVELVGKIEGLMEHYFAISAEKKIRHPAVIAITNTAKSELFV